MKAKFRFSAAFKKEDDASNYVPYSSHVTKSVIKMVNGDYVQIFRLQGAAHESADIDDINSWHNQLNNFLRNISSPNVALWTHIVRRPYGEFPDGEFPEGFTKDFNERYRNHLASSKMLINELYLSIVYRPQPVSVFKIFDIFKKSEGVDRSEQLADELEAINDLSNAALASLDRYEPELLGIYEHNGLLFSEPLEFLSFLTDGEWRRFPVPQAEIRNVFSVSRPFFGKGGLFALKTPTTDIYGAMLTIREYPSITHAGLLNQLLSVPFEFVLTQSFTFLSKPVSEGMMKRQQSRMEKSEDSAKSQVEAIDNALDDLVSNRFVLGVHSFSLFIRASEQKELNENISEAGSILSEAGMRFGREDVGQAAAYWAQLAGNLKYRVRIGNITSRNFAGFASMHNFPIGRIRGNQWGDAVTMFKTTSGAPYYFNFHKGEQGADAKKAAKLDPNHKDLANTVVIGKPGTGKTVLEMVWLAQMQKFHQPEAGKPLSCVLFDKDLGASIGVRAMGGRYYPLKNGRPSGFNPFQLEPTPNNMTFLEQLVKQLVKYESFPITPRQEKQISDAIRAVMDTPKQYRKLSSLNEFFPPTEENGLHMRLSRWCGNGALAWLFDNEEDTLDVDNFPIVGFDVTEFLENDETRTPTILYLFHRIENLFDGRRVAIFLDEFWKLLDDPAFEDLVKNKLATIRKQDGFLIMFTQSPQQVLKSDIAFAIIGQTATKIMLPNPEADMDDYINGFKLTHREYEIVKGLGEKSRQFLIKSGDNSVVGELDLNGFDDELAVLSGNTATSNLMEQVIQDVGDDPNVFIEEFHRRRKLLLGEAA